ncbi:transcriptional regulator, MerR family [delta proteobacterium NaphS2]|nr:transcriptional regulator, MerR family [delta proteobacterium NaphS2]
MEQPSYTIDDLCKLTGYSRRTIRYYVSEGLLEPPAGRGRGGFYYDSHLKRLLQIRALKDRGVRISEIQKIEPEVQASVEPAPTRETWLRLPICSGIELHVREDLEAGKRKAVEALLRIGKSLFEGEREKK